jgi:hypothetical protein
MAADGARHAEKPARTPVASGQRRAVATTMGAPKRRCHPLRDPNPVSGSSTLWMGWATRHADGRRARPFLRANSGVPELGRPDLRGTADCRRRHVAHAGLRQRAGSGRTRRQAATATTATTTSPERQDAPPTRGARPERRVHPHCTGAAAQQVSDVAPVLDPEANGELRIAPVSRRGPLHRRGRRRHSRASHRTADSTGENLAVSWHGTPRTTPRPTVPGGDALPGRSLRNRSRAAL